MPPPDLRNSPQTSQSLLVRLCHGNDHESWQLFFAIYGPVLREYYQRRGLQAADSDDLVQEVLVSVVKAMRDSQYDRAKGSFRAWLGTVAVNRLSNFFRSRACHANLVQVTPDNAAYIDPDSDWVVYPPKKWQIGLASLSTQFM